MSNYRPKIISTTAPVNKEEEEAANFRIAPKLFKRALRGFMAAQTPLIPYLPEAAVQILMSMKMGLAAMEEREPKMDSF